MRSVFPFAVILILVAGCFPGNNSTSSASGGSASGGSGKGGDAGSKGSGGGGGSAGASSGSGGSAGSGGGGSGGSTSNPADAALGGQAGGGAGGGSTGSAQGGSAGATDPSDARPLADGRLGGGGTSSPGGGGGGGRTGGGGVSGGGQAGGGAQGTGGSTAPTPCTFPSNWTVGSATYTTYTLPADITACGYNGNKGANTIKNIVNAGHFAAIPGNSSSDFNTSNRCGACIQIGNAIVTIVDECPFQGNAPCQANPTGHMDLSGAAASAAGVKGDPNVRGQNQWKFVPCPVTGNVIARLKQGNNNEIFIENEIVPIAAVTCAGQTGSRTSYGAWHFASDVPGATCEVTDIANRKISITLGTQQNVDVDTKVQFPKCL